MRKGMRLMTAKRLIAAVLTVFFALALVSCDSGSGDKLAKSGKELYADGNYKEALNSFLAADESGIKFFKKEELYSCIGNCYLKMEDYDNSVEYQLKALKHRWGRAARG